MKDSPADVPPRWVVVYRVPPSAASRERGYQVLQHPLPLAVVQAACDEGLDFQRGEVNIQHKRLLSCC